MEKKPDSPRDGRKSAMDYYFSPDTLDLGQIARETLQLSTPNSGGEVGRAPGGNTDDREARQCEHYATCPSSECQFPTLADAMNRPPVPRRWSRRLSEHANPTQLNPPASSSSSQDRNDPSLNRGTAAREARSSRPTSTILVPLPAFSAQGQSRQIPDASTEENAPAADPQENAPAADPQAPAPDSTLMPIGHS